MTDAPWDDDCMVRYYNSRSALENPNHFISLWNRPLFILIFFIPFQISRHAILLMAIISSISAYSLYRAVKIQDVKNSFMVVPLLLFQAFFFTISRSGLAEPLIVAILSLGYLFFIKRQFLFFAIVGSLIPLARLELSPFLLIWAYILLRNNRWKFIFVLGIPAFLWNLGGYILNGDIIWLFNQTIGKESPENRYGHTEFWHYFLRYIYVIGPIVFYFFFIGFFERLAKRKFDIFIFGQFVLGFFIYVLFSWKLNLGQAAGFLRHLVTISPLAAIFALYGFNYWIQSNKKLFNKNKFEIEYKNRVQQIKSKLAERKLKKNKALQLINIEKIKHKKDKLKNKLIEKSRRNEIIRVMLLSLICTLLAWFFFSVKLTGHHTLSEIKDYTNVIIIGILTLLFFLQVIVFRKKQMPEMIKYTLTIAVIVSTMGFTLITNPPDIHNSPERTTMNKLSRLYLDSYLKDYDSYVNHIFFFWPNDIPRDYDNKFKLITRENLEQAPDSSIIFWETHYSHRLSGDVPIKYFQNKPEYIELFRLISTDKKFTVVIIQKINNYENKDILKIYDRLIAQDFGIPGIHYNRGNFNVNKLKNYKEAIKDYDNALVMDSNYLEAHYNKGMAYFKMNQFENAIKSFERAVELKPDFPNALFSIGLAYNNIGDFKKAIVKYNEAIKAKPDYYLAYINKGNAHFNLNEYNKAILAYTKVIELKPDIKGSYNNRAACYVKTKQFDKAILDYTNLIKLDPSSYSSYYNRAACYLQIGEEEKACLDFQNAEKLGYPLAKGAIQQYCK